MGAPSCDLDIVIRENFHIDKREVVGMNIIAVKKMV